MWEITYVDSVTPNVYDGYDCMNVFMSDVVQEKDIFIQNTKKTNEMK